MQIYMALVDGWREGMIVSMDAEGVSKDNALALAARFLSEIKEKPPEKSENVKSENVKPAKEGKP